MDILDLQIKAYSNNLTTVQVKRIMEQLRPHVFRATYNIVGKTVAIAITVIEPELQHDTLASVQAIAHQTDEPIELLGNGNTD